MTDYLLIQTMSGALSLSQALREPELVEQMKVSRVPVRELESMGAAGVEHLSSTLDAGEMKHGENRFN